MATYVVTLNKAGKGRAEKRAVKVAAPDAKTARSIAESKDWSVTMAVLEPEDAKKKFNPFPRKPLIVMCQSLAAMLDAQIPLPKALEFYNSRLTKEDLRLTLKSISAAISRGDEVHKAFAATGRFDPTFIGLVRAGTMSSNLSSALRALARRMKINADFQAKIRKALLTPTVILVFLWFILIYSMTGLVPSVEKMLLDMRVSADPFSNAVFGFSHVFKATYLPVSIAMIIFALACWRSLKFRTLIFAFLLARWKLFRQIIMGFRQLTFIGTFEMLLANNVPLSDALQTCANTLKKTPLEKELLMVKSQVALGANLGESIRKYTSVDSQLSHMLEIGEKSSNLAAQLRLLRDLYEEETALQIEFFTGFVGVASKILTVSVIAAIYLGTYMPIIMAGPKMMQGVGR